MVRRLAFAAEELAVHQTPVSQADFAAVSDEQPMACRGESDAGTAASENYELEFRLARAADGSEAVGFHVKLHGPETTGESVYLPFRNDQAAGDKRDKDGTGQQNAEPRPDRPVAGLG